MSARAAIVSPRSGLAVVVTDHALWRAAERFPGFDTLRIEAEVHEALAAGRLSVRKPAGIFGSPDPDSLYAWTPDGGRVYALRHDERPPRFVVTTVMRAALAA